MARVLSEATVKKIDEACKNYPTRLAAMLPALHLVMDEVGCISSDAALDVADTLRVPSTRVYEAATFYTMFYTRPQGRHVVKICRNLACELRGAQQIIAAAQKILGVELGATTEDGRVTLETEECLASCGTGPMLWCRSRIVNGKDGAADVAAVIDERIVENLTIEKLEAFLGDLP